MDNITGMNNGSGASGQNRFDHDRNRFDLAVTSVVLLIAFIGNTFVIAVVKQKTNRAINDLFIVNFCVSDVLFAAVSLLSYIFRVLHPGSLTLFYCRAIRPLVTTAFCSSIFTMTSMAVLRCRIMCYPRKPKMQRKTIYWWIVSLWLLSFIMNFPTLLVAMVTPEGTCTGNWPSAEYKDTYIIGFLLLKCVLPLIIITTAYVKIGIYLVRNKRPQTCLDKNRALKCRDTARKENIQIVEVMAAIVLLFGLCSSPHQIAWMLYQFGNKRDKEIGLAIFTFSSILQTIHACVNPFIYGIMSKQFRGEYMKIVANSLDCLTFICCRIGRVVTKIQPAKELKHPNTRLKRKTKRLDENEKISIVNLRAIFDEENSGEKSRVGSTL